MYASGASVFNLSLIPIDQQLLFLPLVEQANLTDSCLGIGAHLFEHCVKMPSHSLNGSRLIQIHAVFQHTANAARRLLQQQHQVKFGRTIVQNHWLHAYFVCMD